MIKRPAALTGLVLLSASPAWAGDHDTTLINIFQTLCAHDPLSFERIDQLATAMKLPDHRHMGEGAASGPFAHSKSWIFSLGTGPHELVVAEANGPNGHITTCGIAATESNGEAFKAALVSGLKLGKPSSESISADGAMRTTLWQGFYGDMTALRLVDATPKGQPGAMLYYDIIAPQIP